MVVQRLRWRGLCSELLFLLSTPVDPPALHFVPFFRIVGVTNNVTLNGMYREFSLYIGPTHMLMYLSAILCLVVPELGERYSRFSLLVRKSFYLDDFAQYAPSKRVLTVFLLCAYSEEDLPWTRTSFSLSSMCICTHSIRRIDRGCCPSSTRWSGNRNG